MKKFVDLILQLEATTSNNAKTEALKNYFLQEPCDKNKLWVVALFSGKKPTRPISTHLIRLWCAERANIPLWLFEENHHIIGDLAETIALILPQATHIQEKPLHVWMEDIIQLKTQSEDHKKEYIFNAWSSLDKNDLWVFSKLMTGGFRIGVSKNILYQALAKALHYTTNEVAFLLSGKWSPVEDHWKKVFDLNASSLDISKPFPFYLCHSIQENTLEHMDLSEWIAEWKWDGIRCQVIKRKDQLFLWSRGEELITHQFPELNFIRQIDQNFVLDGEILCWDNEKAGTFQDLQKRLNRKKPGPKMILSTPVIFMAYDVLEYEAYDLRSISFMERREYLDILMAKNENKWWRKSPILDFKDKVSLEALRMNCREVNAEGLMLKKRSGSYEVGRKIGNMWKWKIDPYTIDAVMIYAQRGHGRRANLYSDYTFALWSNDQLIPFAKAYSGLSDIEMSEITRFVRKNTIETFGPVSKVLPSLVFELAFEGLSLSARHKSGVAVRFPRIRRWRKDKTAEQANSLEDLWRLKQ